MVVSGWLKGKKSRKCLKRSFPVSAHPLLPNPCHDFKVLEAKLCFFFFRSSWVLMIACTVFYVEHLQRIRSHTAKFLFSDTFVEIVVWMILSSIKLALELNIHLFLSPLSFHPSVRWTYMNYVPILFMARRDGYWWEEDQKVSFLQGSWLKSGEYLVQDWKERRNSPLEAISQLNEVMPSEQGSDERQLVLCLTPFASLYFVLIFMSISIPFFLLLPLFSLSCFIYGS